MCSDAHLFNLAYFLSENNNSLISLSQSEVLQGFNKVMGAFLSQGTVLQTEAIFMKCYDGYFT